MLIIGQSPIVGFVRPFYSYILAGLQKPSILHFDNGALAQGAKRRQCRCWSVVMTAMAQSTILGFADNITYL